MSLGSKSLETEDGVQFAPRSEARYLCECGDITIVPFSVEAEIPRNWECRCGRIAVLEGDTGEDETDEKQPRTHWDMLLERRTEEELAVLLDEQLKLLRAGKLRRRFAK